MAIAIFDIFETLLDPEDQGRMTDRISWTVWRVCKLLPIQIMTYAGPLAYVSVLFTWALLLITGGALIYWPFMPDSFAYDSGLDPEHQTGFMTAFYLSFVSFATLGYGDIVPTATWLRLIGPLQTLIGFFLLSAAITWILAIYQDIETRRTLAHETTLLKQALDDGDHRLSGLPSHSIEQLLDELTTRFVSVSGSLNQFPITYFFRISDERQSIAVMALFLSDITEELSHEDLPAEVRLRARMLAGALDHFAEALQGRFVDAGPGSTTREVLEAYAADHERATTQTGNGE
ncbi:MAG: two pore domain potassium channel family protein [Sphaerobacteraceae bacterium]|nr:MAG: two pore domain potassium channel family protein [Sphaerobacteraceae bacterium]